MVRAAQQDWEAQLVVHGDGATLRRAAQALGLDIELHRAGETPRSRRSLELVEITHPAVAAFGQPEPANAASVVASLTCAARACLEVLSIRSRLLGGGK